MLLILVLGGLEAWRRWQSRHLPQSRAYYAVRPWQRGVIAAAYLGLAAALVLAMGATHIERDFGDV